MKTSVKQLAAGTLLALLIMVGNTNAIGTEVESLTPEIEAIFDIENWMIDENLWEIQAPINFEIVEETEIDLELETWMTSEEIWNTTTNIIEEKDSELIVEDWMLSEKVWDVE